MDIDKDIYQVTQLITHDIAIAGKKLDELSFIKGGEKLAFAARRAVRQREYRGEAVLNAIREVYSLVAQDKL